MKPLGTLLFPLALFAASFPASAVGQFDDWTSFRQQAAEAVSTGDPKRLRALAVSLEDLEGAPAGWSDYWAAYLDYRTARLADDKAGLSAALEACLRKARAAADAGTDDSPLRAESQALLGACHASLAGTGGAAGMEHGPRAAMLRDESLLTSPDNPRVLILAGVQDVWTPVQWGGSPERAVRRLQRALQRLDVDSPAPPWQPRWGRIDAIGHLALALGRLDRSDEARAVLERARTEGDWNGWLAWVGWQIHPGDTE